VKRQKDKHSAKTLWLTMILVFGFVAPILIPNTVSADSLGYPWPTDAEAPCEFGSAGGVSCANPANPIYDLYDWGVYTGSTFHPYRSGYEYRNCTDYVQWKESTIGVTVPGNWNDGGLWYDNAPSTMRTTTPRPTTRTGRPTCRSRRTSTAASSTGAWPRWTRAATWAAGRCTRSSCRRA